MRTWGGYVRFWRRLYRPGAAAAPRRLAVIGQQSPPGIHSVRIQPPAKFTDSETTVLYYQDVDRARQGICHAVLLPYLQSTATRR